MGDAEDYIREALKKGIAEIGFSEHIILHHVKDYPYLPIKDMKRYVQRFIKLKENVGIQIKLGAEIDFCPEDKNKIRKFIQKYPFDYVIGAVHFLEDWIIDSPSQMHRYLRKDIDQIYEDYFSTVRKLAHSQLFDVLAHPDLIKIFGFKPRSDITSILEETAQALAKSNMCIEINANGLTKPCTEIYPSDHFLKILHTYEVPATLASDAHKPENVGKNLDKAITLLKRAGYTHICLFNQREKRKIKI